MMAKKKKQIWRSLLKLFIVLLILVAAFIAWFMMDTRITPPAVNTALVNRYEREQAGPDHYVIGNNWLRKNEYGIWEMYLEGGAFERGVISGKLSKELIYKQEQAFVDQIRQMIPSESYLNFLKYFIRFFNRDLDEYVLPEFQQEIYGISFSASDQFDFIGTNYERMLNYHGAHDIGHALQDLMLVGCTSFAANMGFADSSLILGRNFDFYINDAFAEDKVVCFVKPDKGHAFAFVTWASFIGVVSGMNEQGISVTINAGKSDIPFKAATPISLLAREILQYAGSIEEAVTIAESRKTFVAESLLIGSANDNKAAIIEKSPSNMGVYENPREFLVCSNHFQSEAFSLDTKNQEHIIETASAYRQQRSEELLSIFDSISPLEASYILRDRFGLQGRKIGVGNEKAMAQMISHHSVIFQPIKQNMWVSTPPFQLGAYLGYHLPDVFHPSQQLTDGFGYDTALTIPPDPFLNSKEYADFKDFKKMRDQVNMAIGLKKPLPQGYIKSFTGKNPDYFQVYVLAGDYYRALDSTERARAFYEYALGKEFEKLSQRRELENKISSLE